MKNWRVNLVFILFLVISAAVISRLVFLQILEGDLNKALSQGLFASFNELQGERGEVFFKNGEPLAINVDLPFVFVNPRKIENPEQASLALSQILDLDKDFLLEKLTNNSSYSLIQRRLSAYEAEQIQDLNLEGVFVSEQKERYYPQEKLASQIIGFLGAEGIGQYGLEQFYDKTLRGKEGFMENEKGADLILTIDYNIQYQAEKLLEKAKTDLAAEGGQIIVIEPDSGRILAMADMRGFNPNYYEEYAKQGNLDIFKNRAARNYLNQVQFLNQSQWQLLWKKRR